VKHFTKMVKYTISIVLYREKLRPREIKGVTEIFLRQLGIQVIYPDSEAVLQTTRLC